VNRPAGWHAGLGPADLDARARQGALDLPPPGGGHTAERFAELEAWGREDLTLARLVEGHADAAAICAEAGVAAPAGLLAVWASEGPGSQLEAERRAGGWWLAGDKRYCSGSTLVSHALVTARSPDGPRLLVLPTHSSGLAFDRSGWVAPAFAGTATATMTAAGVLLGPDAAVGPPGWYLSRPGFWHGAVGVAACWAGGALGLADVLRRSGGAAPLGGDPHALAHLGAVDAAGWSMEALLAAAAGEIDGDPDDRAGRGRERALIVRHEVEQRCLDVVERFGRAVGPGPLAFDAAVARRVAELTLYLRQGHAERDLEELGRLRATRAGAPAEG